ncbi:alpha/beta fold hydrolase [Actinoplanes rectilineatus]|uniref:alpha/beta fold hydrolase n=1 Tax=Actinoplanes rectilineatus TaxID=113571 RepID=UPI0005F2BBA4|nr:alpha/beta fold hydrolase [Actinoplanes rectilineatus]
MPVGEFRNDQARDRFHAVHQELMDRLWPPESVPSDVDTGFGTTRVHRLGGGAGDGVPFVLLPGSGGPSLMWHAYVRRLAASRPVIAVDPVGEPGPSVQTRAIDSGADWSRWLGEVLSGLGVRQAHLVGTSYGGWVALCHSLHAPESVASLSLFDPGGFGEVSRGFIVWMIAGGLTTFTPRPVRHALARTLRNVTLRDDDAVRLVKATFGFRRRHILPTPLTDGDLARITAPTLLVVGGHSQLYDARQVAARVTAHMPHAVAEIVPGAAHDLVMWEPGERADRVVRFASGAVRPGPGAGGGGGLVD